MTVREYLRPRSAEEAIVLLGRHGPDLLVLAGGTLAMPLVNDGVALPERVMTLRGAGLDRLARDGATFRIGATVSLTTLLEHRDPRLPDLLRRAAHAIASPTIRNLATVGGNLFAPPPAGDLAVALLALDARVRIAGPRGERETALAEFFTGFLTTALGPDELVTEVIVDSRPRRTSFVRLGRKHANTPAVVTVAAAIDVVPASSAATARGVRIAVGAAGPRPVRATAAEALLEGRRLTPAATHEAADVAASGTQPFSDGVASAWYRRRMAAVVVRQALERLGDSAGAGVP